MQTYVMSRRDGNDYVYDDVITAPDHQTATRLFAMRMLQENETDLIDEQSKSLAEYANQTSLDEDWTAGEGDKCPSCNSIHSKKMEAIQMASMGISPVDNADRAKVCGTCAYVWIAVGHLPELRKEIERETLREMENIDSFESKSLGLTS